MPFLQNKKTLQLLYLELEDSSKTNGIVNLASVLLFINLELIDSGGNDWRPHVEGAGMLINGFQLPQTVQTFSTDSFRDCLVYVVFLFEPCSQDV